MADKTEAELKQEKEIAAILYGLNIILDATGHGSLTIIVRDGVIAEIRAEHVIRPKYLKVPE